MALTDDQISIIQKDPEKFYNRARWKLDNVTEDYNDDEIERLEEIKSVSQSFLSDTHNITIMESIPDKYKVIISEDPGSAYKNAKNFLYQDDLTDQQIKDAYSIANYAASLLENSGKNPEDYVSNKSFGKKVIDAFFLATDKLDNLAAIPLKSRPEFTEFKLSQAISESRQDDGGLHNFLLWTSSPLVLLNEYLNNNGYSGKLENITSALSTENIIESFSRVVEGTERDDDPNTNYFSEWAENTSDYSGTNNAGFSGTVFKSLQDQYGDYLKNVYDKVASGDSLTDDDLEFYKYTQNQILTGGILGGVFLDPLNAIGKVGTAFRAGNSASDATKIMNSLKGANAFDDTIESVKNVARYALKSGTNISGDAKKTLLAMDAVKSVDEIYDATKISDIFKTATKAGRETVSFADNFKPGIKELPSLLKGTGVEDVVEKSIKAIADNDAAKYYLASSTWANIVYPIRAGVNIAIRESKAYQSVRNIMAPFRRAFSDSALSVKKFFDRARSQKNYIKNFGSSVNDQVDVSVDSMRKSAKKSGMWKGKRDEDARSWISKLIERPDKVSQLVDEYGEAAAKTASETAESISKNMNEMFLDEVGQTGKGQPFGLAEADSDYADLVKQAEANYGKITEISPELNTPEFKKKWISEQLGDATSKVEEYKSLASNYHNLYLVDPYSQEALTARESLSQFIDDINKTTGTPQYYSHVFSEAGSNYINLFKGDKNASDKMVDVSWNKRTNRIMTADEMNDVIKTGDPKQIRQAFKKDYADILVDFSKSHPGEDFFETDAGKIFMTRANRAAKVVASSVLDQELSKYILKYGATTGDFSFEPIEGFIKNEGLSEVLGKNVYASRDMTKSIQTFNKVTDPQFLHNARGAIVRTMDRVNALIRKGFLIGHPSYHIRNEVGNIYSLALAGALNPVDMDDAMRAIRFMKSKGDTFTITAKNGRVYTASDIIDLAKKNDVLGNSASVEVGVSGKINSFFTDIRRPFTRSRNLKSGEGIVSKGLDYLEGIQNINPLQAALGPIGRYLEDQSRMTLFINRLKNGMSPVDAASDVKKYLFDYSDLSEIEKNVVKRVAFFYTWARKNLFLQINNALSITNRRIFTTVNKINKYNESNREPGVYVDTRFQADYLANMPKLTLNTSNSGRERNYWALQNFIPPYEMFGVINDVFGKKGELGPVGSAISGVVQSSTPIIKTAAELFANRSTFSGNEISKYDGDTTTLLGINMPARVAHVLKNMSRYISTINAIYGSGEKLSMFGRAKMTPDMDKGLVAAKLAIGTPLQYQPSFSRIFSKKENYNYADEILSGLMSDLYRIRENYTGEEMPVEDFRDIYSKLKEVYAFIEEQNEYSNISEYDSLISYVDGIVKMLNEEVAKYGNNV